MTREKVSITKEKGLNMNKEKGIRMTNGKGVNMTNEKKYQDNKQKMNKIDKKKNFSIARRLVLYPKQDAFNIFDATCSKAFIILDNAALV